MPFRNSITAKTNYSTLELERGWIDRKATYGNGRREWEAKHVGTSIGRTLSPTTLANPLDVVRHRGHRLISRYNERARSTLVGVKPQRTDVVGRAPALAEPIEVYMCCAAMRLSSSGTT